MYDINTIILDNQKIVVINLMNRLKVKSLDWKPIKWNILDDSHNTYINRISPEGTDV